MFPALDATFINEDELFGDYYRFFDDRMQRDRVQPFFNSVETPPNARRSSRRSA